MKLKPVYDKSAACKEEGFEVIKDRVIAYGKEFPVADPLTIYLNLYRTHQSQETRYQCMKRAFEIIWPKQIITYNYWMERVFREHCNFDTDVFTLAGGGGIGKAIPYNTPVHTPTGYVTAGSLAIGSIISSTDSTTQMVTGIFPQGTRKVYRIDFSDNTFSLVDEAHLWQVQSYKQRDRHTGKHIYTTKQIQANIHHRLSVPNYTAVPGVETILPIHPYLMGILLGNGSLTEESLNAYISDETCVKKIQSIHPNTSVKYIERSHCWRLGILGIRNKCEVKELANKKYIPKEYLTASTKDRIELLQGLMDTDGTISKQGTAQYTTISPQLRDDVLYLARSLGFLCTFFSKIPKFSYKGEVKTGQKAYTINIRRTHTTKNLPLVTVPHKLERDRKPRKQFYHKIITAVTYSHDEPTMCIKVSNPNELFFINDFTVTHNTQSSAYVACLFWLALPHKRAVIVASTELASLKNRIYGYILRALEEATINIPLIISNSPPPSIRYDANDFMHGIFGVAAKKGDDDKTIQSIKGRHPVDSLLLILDEATDMPIGITTVVPNLKKGLAGRFQAMALGNSKSWTDLHGLWSYPKVGTENIDPKLNFRWETTQPGGVCLYFNPYDSPAIHETDPIKKSALSTFLITEDKLIKAEREEGVDSDGFWQFTMGFWRNKSLDPTIVTESFLKDYDPTHVAEFSGYLPLQFCAGLDPAFSVGGDKCILRLAVLGHHVNGKIVLDYRNESLKFEIKLRSNTGKSAEIQIADEVIRICKQYNVALNTLCIDASGAGRGLADVIQLRSEGVLTPTKIYSTNLGYRKAASTAFDIVISSAHEMWFKGREFISHHQIFGMDTFAYNQLHTRLVIEVKGKKSLENKDAYKKRMAASKSSLARSPDEADAAMLCLQSAVLYHGFFPGQTKGIVHYNDEVSRRFAMALKGYQESVAPTRKGPFELRGSYSNGIESLLKKKMF